MARKNTVTPIPVRYPEAAPRQAAHRREWLLDAVRHVFTAAMADRRG